MTAHLTQKEKSLLKDQMGHEEVCIQKYRNYAQRVQDPQLQQMFNEFAAQEQRHYQTLQQFLQGQPGGASGQQGMMSGMAGQIKGQAQRETREQAATAGQTQAGGGQVQAGMSGQEDAMLLNDMLMTEKYVSGAYDTAIFEFANMDIRRELQHIQKEEQQHGEGIFNYMRQHGMYQPQ